MPRRKRLTDGENRATDERCFPIFTLKLFLPMKKLINILIAMVSLAFFASCSSAQEETSKIVINSVLRVFLHQPATRTTLGSYSIMYRGEKDEFSIKSLDDLIPIKAVVGTIKFTQAKPDEPMKVELILKEHNIFNPDRWTAVIYIHGPEDVNGGGWNHGKGGKGQTLVVQ